MIVSQNALVLLDISLGSVVCFSVIVSSQTTRFWTLRFFLEILGVFQNSYTLNTGERLFM